jgi:hypothetical protein
MSSIESLSQTALALLASAVAIALAAWPKSAVYLPVPAGPLERWLRAIPLLAAVIVMGILDVWFNDCSHRLLLTVCMVIAFALCTGLIIAHAHMRTCAPAAPAPRHSLGHPPCLDLLGLEHRWSIPDLDNIDARSGDAQDGGRLQERSFEFQVY